MVRIFFVQAVILSLALSLGTPGQQNQPQHVPEAEADSAASIGLVLDNSKSMASKRDAMVAAMHLLVEASDPQDQFLVVNFNEKPKLDQVLTTDRKLISSAIDKADSHGGTALYDAVATSAAYLNKVARFKKRAVIVVFDHGDNMSHISFNQLLHDVEPPATKVSIYCVGLFDPGDAPRDAQIFRELAKRTGGKALFVPKPKKLNQEAQQLADELGKAGEQSH